MYDFLTLHGSANCSALQAMESGVSQSLIYSRSLRLQTALGLCSSMEVVRPCDSRVNRLLCGDSQAYRHKSHTSGFIFSNESYFLEPVLIIVTLDFCQVEIHTACYQGEELKKKKT